MNTLRQGRSELNLVKLLRAIEFVRGIIREAKQVRVDLDTLTEDNLLAVWGEGRKKAYGEFDDAFSAALGELKEMIGNRKSRRLLAAIEHRAQGFASASADEGFIQGYLVGHLGIRPEIHGGTCDLLAKFVEEMI